MNGDGEAVVNRKLIAISGAVISLLLAVSGALAWKVIVERGPDEHSADFERVNGRLNEERILRENADVALTKAISGIANDVQSLQTQFTALQDDMRSANTNSLAARTAAETNTAILKEIKRKLP
jgi:hypothetical protein